MDRPFPQCTVPVEISGKVIEFGLRPDRFYTRIPLDIWCLFRTSLMPLPPPETVVGDDVLGCLGLCTVDFSVLNRTLMDHTVAVDHDPIPSLGSSSLKVLGLVYSFADRTVHLDKDISVDPRQRSLPLSERNVDYPGSPEDRSNSSIGEPHTHQSRIYERDEYYLEDLNKGRASLHHPNSDIESLQSGLRLERLSRVDEQLRDLDNRISDIDMKRTQTLSVFQQPVKDVRDSHESFGNVQAFLDIQQGSIRNTGPLQGGIIPYPQNNFGQMSTQAGIPVMFQQGFGLNVVTERSKFQTAQHSSGLQRSMNNSRPLKKAKKVPCGVCHKFGHATEACFHAPKSGASKPPFQNIQHLKYNKNVSQPSTNAKTKAQCKVCHKFGHATADCFHAKPNAKRSKKKKKNDEVICSICSRHRHTAENCPTTKNQLVCSICKRHRHDAANCTTPRCTVCENFGHTAANCFVGRRNKNVNLKGQ